MPRCCGVDEPELQAHVKGADMSFRPRRSTAGFSLNAVNTQDICSMPGVQAGISSTESDVHFNTKNRLTRKQEKFRLAPSHSSWFYQVDRVHVDICLEVAFLLLPYFVSIPGLDFATKQCELPVAACSMLIFVSCPASQLGKQPIRKATLLGLASEAPSCSCSCKSP